MDDEHIKPHQAGWEGALQEFKNYVEGNEQSLPENAPGKEQHPPITGYIKTPGQQKVGRGSISPTRKLSQLIKAVYFAGCKNLNVGF